MRRSPPAATRQPAKRQVPESRPVSPNRSVGRGNPTLRSDSDDLQVALLQPEAEAEHEAEPEPEPEPQLTLPLVVNGIMASIGAF